MKKVLSVLLAAAMVMGMSITASAANFFGPEDPDAINNTNVSKLYFDRVVIVDEDGNVKAEKAEDLDYSYLAAGDTMYFQVMGMDANSKFGYAADCDWLIKVSHDEFVEDASIITAKASHATNYGLIEGAAYVMIEISEDFDHFVEKGVDFFFYIYNQSPLDGQGKKSETAYVKYNFEEYRQVLLCADDCDHKHSTTEPVPEHVIFEENGHYIPVSFDDPAEYILCDKCFTTSQKVVFVATSKATDAEVLFEGKMIPGEKYLTAVNYSFDKALTKAYDVDMVVLTIDSEMKVDAIFESSKDDKVVLEVIDGELYEVESEYVTKYEVIEDEKLVKGYKVENLDNGQFVLVDEDADLDWYDNTRKDSEAPAVEADKANPSTGASDFVGAAVAMAVVSVAAAGALALKK